MNELVFFDRLWVRLVAVSVCLVAAGNVHSQPYPEAFGADDFRISVMGPENNLAFTASQLRPSIAIQPDAEEGLIAWRGNDQGKDDIFVRRIRMNGLGGTGPEMPVLNEDDVLWPDIPRSPAIACSLSFCLVAWVGEIDNEPAVVWRRTDLQGNPLSITRTTPIEGYVGAPVTALFDPDGLIIPGGNGSLFLMLTMVPCGAGTDTTIVAIRQDLFQPATIAVEEITLAGRCLNSQPLRAVMVPEIRKPLVTWYETSEDGNIEVFASFGLEFGGEDPESSRISLTWNGSSFGNAVSPDVAHDPESGQSLVVWEGNGDASNILGESEIYAQMLAAPTSSEQVHPVEMGTDDLRVSFTMPEASTTRDAFLPAVAWDGGHQVFAVSWHSDDQAFLLANNEFEAFIQGVDLAGNLTRSTPLRLSRMGGPDQLGGTGDSAWDALDTVVVASRGRALVAWWGSQQMFPLNIGGATWRDEEIWGQTALLGLPLLPNAIFADSYEEAP